MNLNATPGMPMPAVIPQMTHGHHACLFFSSPEDQAATTVPFLAIGLERGERCVYVGDPASVDFIGRGLAEADIDVAQEVRRNRLVLSSDRDYLDAGVFSTDKMLGFLQQAYDAAIGDGHTALRAAGDVAWEVGPRHDFADLVYYETLLDVFFLGKRMVGMCQYPRQSCPPEVLAGILNTHRIAAIDGTVCSNFHYVPPELLLEKDPTVRQAKRVEWMTSQLLRARAAEEENRRLNAELEQRVVERTAQLEAAYRDMEAFSYSVSHDLRSPLRAISGFSAALEEDGGDALAPVLRGHLDRIRAGANRMSQLIEVLLLFSRTSRAPVSMAPVDMTAIARAAAEDVGAQAVIHPLPPTRGDASLLRQVFVNLLSNAVKFTRGRSYPRIEVGATTDGVATAYYVKDNGAGFDPAGAARLFGVFQRLHAETEFEGTGIGLAIVDRVVRRHGGTVKAEGRPGEGATFTFTLPGAGT